MSEEVPELQVLSNYIGAWEVVATSDEGPASSGRSTTKWILDGAFIQTTGSVKAADGSTEIKVASIMTYDPFKKAYRRWSFMSNGHTEESEGTWDATTRTMTMVTRYGTITQTSKSSFEEDGVESWIMVNKGEDGKVLSEMRGTNTRRED